MIRWCLVLALVGCGGELSVDPTNIDYGSVDFNVPTPDAGHDAREITVQNTGGGELEVVILDLDAERFSLGGQFTELDPPRLVLGSGDLAVMTLGVSGYTPGETGNTVSGSFLLASSRLRDDIEITWSYVPERE